MSLPAYALTTLARVKARVGIANATTDFDTVLERNIMIATSIIESACSDRRFYTTAHAQEVHNIEQGQTVVYLKHWDVSALTLVEYNYGTPGTPAWTTLVADNYALMDQGKNGRVRLYTAFQGINAIRFTYTAGYLIDWANEFSDTHTLPFEITDLAERIALAKFNKRTDDGKAIQSSQEMSITWEKDLLSAGDLDLLVPYQRVRFA